MQWEDMLEYGFQTRIIIVSNVDRNELGIVLIKHKELLHKF